MSSFILFIENSRIIRIESTNLDELNSIKTMKEFNLDFDDSIQLTICDKYNLSIISFDKHFDKTSIKRIEPHQIKI